MTSLFVFDYELSMSCMAFIRRSVFQATQSEMATIAGVSQSTVSKWEAGQLEPDRVELQRIRDEAARRAKPWSDGWFFSAATLPMPAQHKREIAL